MLVILILGGHESRRRLYLHVVMNLGWKPWIILFICCCTFMLVSSFALQLYQSPCVHSPVMFEPGWLFGVCAHTVCETAKESSWIAGSMKMVKIWVAFHSRTLPHELLTSKNGVSSFNNLSLDLFSLSLISSSKNKTSYSRGDLVRRSVMNWVNICELTNWAR